MSNMSMTDYDSMISRHLERAQYAQCTSDLE